MTEEIIDWYGENKGTEIFAVARYRNKLMSVVLNFRVMGLEANLKAMITSPRKEDEKREIEYSYNRFFVGAGEEFQDKMITYFEYKKVELEFIAMEKDLDYTLMEIFVRNKMVVLSK